MTNGRLIPRIGGRKAGGLRMRHCSGRIAGCLAGISLQDHQVHLPHGQKRAHLPRNHGTGLDAKDAGHPGGRSVGTGHDHDRGGPLLREIPFLGPLIQVGWLLRLIVGAGQRFHTLGQSFDPKDDLPGEPLLLSGGDGQFAGLARSQVEPVLLDCELAGVRNLGPHQQAVAEVGSPFRWVVSRTRRV